MQLTIVEAWGYAVDGSLQGFMFLLEFGLGVTLPFIMLLYEKVRRSPRLLFTACTLYIVFGVVLNRINVFFIAYQPPYSIKQYIPSFGEFAVTIGLIAAFLLLYRGFVTIFPILPTQKKT